MMVKENLRIISANPFERVTLFLLLFLSIGTLLITIYQVFLSGHPQIDNVAFEKISPYINDSSTTIMRAISFFGSRYFLLPANILMAGYFLFLLRLRWNAIRVAIVSLGSVTIMSLLKLYFQRLRPDHPVYLDAEGYSFPSGHSMSAMTFYGLLIYFVWQASINWRIKCILVIVLVLAIFFIGLSRIYLRVHYSTDVLAGFAFGVIWLLLSLCIIRFYELRSKNKVIV